MRSIPNNAPSNVAALDERDPNAGNASHLYGIQFAPEGVLRIQFIHGARATAEHVPGVFDDDLLAIIQDRLEGFQSGQFACPENEEALVAVKAAREALGRRLAVRMSKNILGKHEQH